MRCILPPAVEPVDPAGAQAVQRIQVKGGPIPPLEEKIIAAREWVEGYLSRAIMAQVWDFTYDDIPGSFPVSPTIRPTFPSTVFDEQALTLPMAPLRNVLGIYVTDDGGTETLVSPSIYDVTRSGDRDPRISLKTAESWPYHRSFEGFRIRALLGYAQPVSVNIATNTLTVVGHGYREDDPIRLSVVGGDPPAPLQARLDYYAVGVTDNTLQLSLTPGGAAVDITAAGTGTLILGAVPSAILRAIKEIAALETLPSKQSQDGGMNLDAINLLRPYRIIRI